MVSVDERLFVSALRTIILFFESIFDLLTGLLEVAFRLIDLDFVGQSIVAAHLARDLFYPTPDNLRLVLGFRVSRHHVTFPLA
jgi:hypothetical protein